MKISALELEKMKERYKNDVAIIGIGCRFPDAGNYIEFWHNLRDGKNSIKELLEKTIDTPDGPKTTGRWNEKFYSKDFDKPNTTVSKWCGLINNIDYFDNKFFNISPREARNIDPQQRLLLEEAWHCIEDSGVPLKQLRETTTSVYIGVMASDYNQEASNEDVLIDSYAGLGNYDCILANRLSYFFNFSGISMAVDSACASSLVAIHEGRHSLLQGESDFVLAGGVSLNIHPWKYISFSKSRMLSSDGQCKTFDKDANGYVPGEGIAVVLMQRMSDALEDGNHIYGIIKGSSVNHGGATRSITAPRVEAQQALILKSYEEAGFSPHTISYMEAHGTGTSLGDPIETEALKKAFYEFIPRQVEIKEFENKILSYITNKNDRNFLENMYYRDKRKERYILLFDDLKFQIKRKIFHLKQSSSTRKIPDKNEIIQLLHRLRKILIDINYIPEDRQFCKIGSVKTNIGHLEASAGVAGVIKVLMMMKYRQIPPTLNLVTRNPIINWKKTPFILAGYDARITEFANSIRERLQLSHISPVVFNEKTLHGVAHKLLELHEDDLMNRPAYKSFTKTQVIAMLQDEFLNIAARVFNITVDKLSPTTELYKKVETWYCPEIYKLTRVFDDMFKIGKLDPELISGSSINAVIDLIIKNNMVEINNYYEEQGIAHNKIIDKFKNDIIDIVANIYRIDKKTIDTDKVLRDYQTIPLRAGVSSFGFGGVNSHVLLEEFSQRYKHEEDSDYFNLFILSAKSKESLMGILDKWRMYYTSNAFRKYSLKDICSNLMLGREQFQYRCGFKIPDKNSLIPYLEQVTPVKVNTIDNPWALRIGTVTWEGFEVIEDLYNQVEIFREELTVIKKVFMKHKNTRSLYSTFQKNNWAEKNIRLFSFITAYAFIKSLFRLGFKPDIIIPEDKGILLGLTLSGIISLNDAIQYLTSNRSMNDLTFSRPKIPYYDYLLEKTIMPFHFNEEYLKMTVQEITHKNKQLGKLLVNGVFDDESGHTETRLGAVLVRNGLITEDELNTYLLIQKKTGKMLGDIVTAEKKDVDPDDLNACLREQELIHYYVDDVLQLDKASLLNEGQYTFKRYLEEWDVILQSKGRNITQILNDKKLLSEIKGESTREKTLLMIIIMSSLHRLNQKWNLMNQKLDDEFRFYELLDLLVDGVILKEDVIEIFLDDHPNYTRITQTMNKRQKFGDLNKPYTFIRGKNKILPEIMQAGGPEKWFKQSSKAVPVFITDKTSEEKDFAFIEKDDLSFFEFGEIIQSGDKNPLRHVLPGSNPAESFKNSVLNLWLSGINMNWELLVKTGNYNRLALPMYPFNGKSYWLKKKDKEEAKTVSVQKISQPVKAVENEKESDKGIPCFTPNWINAPLLETTVTVNDRTALVFCNNDEFNEKFNKRLTQYQKIIYIHQSTEYSNIDGSYKINPDSQEHMDTLFTDITRDNPYFDIYYLWPMTHSNESTLDSPGIFEQTMRHLFFLSQNVIMFTIASKNDVNLTIVTHKGIPKTGMEKNYAYGGLPGFIKTLQLENSKLHCKIIDFDTSDSNEEFEADTIYAEMNDPSDIVVYRNNKRYIPSFTSGHFNPVPGNILRNDGTYLIVGGAGGIGTKITELFCNTIQNGTIILVGRSPITERRQEVINGIDKKTNTLVYLHCNITDEEAVKTLLTGIKEKYGALNGIIQSSGILEDTFMLNKTWDSFQRVLAPKVHGTWYLNEYTKDEPLDFFVVFSSIVGVTGNVGQADYAAANSYLDSLIHYRKNDTTYPGKSISINWTLWEDGGMGTSETVERYFSTEYDPGNPGLINSSDAVSLFNTILNSEHSQVVVTGNPNYFNTNRPLTDESKIQSVGITESAAPAETSNNHEEALEMYVTDLIASLLDYSSDVIDKEESFFSLGVESIMVQNITNELSKTFGKLSPTLLFEYPNITTLTEHLKSRDIQNNDFLNTNSPLENSASIMSMTENDNTHETTILQPKSESLPELYVRSTNNNLTNKFSEDELIGLFERLQAGVITIDDFNQITEDAS